MSPRGMWCPNCGKRTVTHTVRRPAPGLVVRYRKCVDCGWRVTTEERVRPPRPRK